MESEFEGEELEANDEESNFRQLGRKIRTRLNSDNDFWIACSGFEGVGKSSFSIKLAQEIEKDGFSVEKCVIVNPDVRAIEEKILHSDARCVIIDEGIRVLYKRRFYSDENVFLNELSAICRKERKCVIINIPNLRDLDRGILQHRIRLWAFIPQRGHVALFAPDLSPFEEDKWHMRENSKLILQKRGKGKIADLSPDMLIDILSHSPNFITQFNFSKLRPEVEKEYLDLVTKFRKQMSFNESEDKRAIKHKKRFGRLIEFCMNEGYTGKQIGEACEMQEDDVKSFLYNLRERGWLERK